MVSIDQKWEEDICTLASLSLSAADPSVIIGSSTSNEREWEGTESGAGGRQGGWMTCVILYNGRMTQKGGAEGGREDDIVHFFFSPLPLDRAADTGRRTLSKRGIRHSDDKKTRKDGEGGIIHWRGGGFLSLVLHCLGNEDESGGNDCEVWLQGELGTDCLSSAYLD